MSPLIRLAEAGRLPDPLIRVGIRRLLRRRLAEASRGGPAEQAEALRDLIRSMDEAPIALDTRAANEQHYELPPEFFTRVLGPRLKYSCAWYPRPDTPLARAEEEMLRLTTERADLADGQRILELGCGWGSLSLWVAEHFPAARITAVSNSAPQRAFILARAADRGLTNLEVITADMNTFDAGPKPFDRVVSVEMFEHMRNHRRLMERVAGWLKPGGRFFMHIFTHRHLAYLFETQGEDDWMGRHFFTGGMMPADALPLHFQDHLRIEAHWLVDGTHYQRTAEDWLRNMDTHRGALTPVLESVYGPAQADRWRQRWRIFFMACAELWGYAGGSEWLVSHYRFRRPATDRP